MTTHYYAGADQPVTTKTFNPMRPLKFRAWNFPMERMFSAEEMAEDQMTLLPTGQFINVHSASTSLSKIYPLDVMVPMQFTGLTDKHGKEIYEGDIILTDMNRKKIVDWNYNLLDRLSDTEVEIIGNIYENKEIDGRLRDSTVTRIPDSGFLRRGNDNVADSRERPAPYPEDKTCTDPGFLYGNDSDPMEGFGEIYNT